MAGKGALTRQTIIEKSIRLFSVKGYFHTSIADIVKECGLSKGCLYGHFRSKEEIWYASYDECVRIWKSIVLKDVRDIPDPLERIQKVVENSLQNYLGADILDGGCFLFNSLVEFSRQSTTMSNHILQGFKAFSELLHSWLEEAERKGMLLEGLNLREIANFVLISLNGAGPLYTSSKDPEVWKQAISQLKLHLCLLKRPSSAA